MFRPFAPTVALLTLITAAGSAQTSPHELGVILGPNIANFKTPSGITADNRAGPLVGAFYRFGANRPLGIEPELLFIQQGATIPLEEASNGYDQIRYLELPVMARLQLFSGRTVRPYLLAGPAVSLRIGCAAGRVAGSLPVSEGCSQAASKFSNTNVSGVMGAGVAIGQVDIGARYDYGFEQINASTPGEPLKTRSLGVTLGLALHR